jgi:hypothetical protein
MNTLNQTLAIKRWQVFVLLGTCGYALGSVLAKITTALGF